MLISEEKPGAAGGGPVGCRRRRWSEAQKRQIVAETHEPQLQMADARFSKDLLSLQFGLYAHPFGLQQISRDSDQFTGQCHSMASFLCHVDFVCDCQ